MDMVNELVKLVYLAGHQVDENGNIKRINQNNEPVDECISSDDARRLVLPTKYHFSGKEDPSWEQRFLFNPLAELISQEAPNKCLEWLIRAVSLRINVTISLILEHVIEVSSSPAMHAKLTPDQLAFIGKIEGVDEKVKNFFEKSIFTLGQRGEFAFVRFFPKHLGLIGDIQYKRTCHVSSPMLDELKGKRKFGKNTEMAKGHSAKVVELINLILPKIEVADYYSVGSNSNVAPFAEAFLNAVQKVIIDVERAQRVWPELFEDTLPQFSFFDVNGLDVFRNLDSLGNEIRKIPVPAHLVENNKKEQQQQTRTIPKLDGAIVETSQPSIPPPTVPYDNGRVLGISDRNLNGRYSEPQPRNTARSGTMSIDDIIRNQNGGGRYGGNSRYRDDYDDRDYRDDRYGGRRRRDDYYDDYRPSGF